MYKKDDEEDVDLPVVDEEDREEYPVLDKEPVSLPRRMLIALTPFNAVR